MVKLCTKVDYETQEPLSSLPPAYFQLGIPLIYFSLA